MKDRLQNYFSTLNRLLLATEVMDGDGNAVPLEEGIVWAMEKARATHDGGNKLMFIGNGGSAGTCSHMATDYSKNGNIRSMAFNDPAFLTCLGNDLGYAEVFARQVDFHGREGDLLVAISSSGKSENILRAVRTARQKGCRVLSFSGFSQDNPLRRAGDMNFYVASNEYGFVEVGHLALCHAILDLLTGWRNGN